MFNKREKIGAEAHKKEDMTCYIKMSEDNFSL